MSDKVKERHEKILSHLQTLNTVSVNQLAGLLNVSVETIRKDLIELTKMDLVIRVHGGVGLSRQMPNDLEAIHQMNKVPKRVVTGIAVELVKPDNTILLGDGSTVYTLAQVLRYSRPELLATLTVITNSFPIVSLFEMGKLCKRLFLLGGMCDHARQSTSGHFASQQLSSFHIQQLFIAPAGISPALNVVTYTASDAAFQIEAIKHADEKVLITDKSKFLSGACFNVAALSSFDHVVTDMASS